MLVKFFQPWTTFSWPICPFEISLLLWIVICLLFRYFLIFWHCKVLQNHLVYFLPHLRMNHFPKEHCCCCCWVASVVSNSVWPHRQQPTRLPHPWDSQGKNTRVGCHFLLQCMKGKSESEVIQSCPTPQDPMDCSPPGSSVHGIFQARVLEWGAIAFSTRSNGSLYW